MLMLGAFWMFVPLLSCDGGTVDSVTATTPPGTTDSGIAVVELFTSEGCSSCPPAEQVLGDIAAAADRGSRPIYALAFHVDYWNNLGWADPFSSAAFSARQSQYSKWFGLDEVYTPQMIVNGHTQFNGSDSTAASKAIADVISKPAAAKVKMSVVPADDGGETVHYVVTPVPPHTVVNVAVIERGLSSRVERGENAGRELHDPNAVRWFTTDAINGNGSADIKIPALPAVKLDHASIIVYVQQSSDGAVVGAASAPFPVATR